ncbi:hypothetical protein [Micromonospora carbonacea]|uniref:Uncharacterized protein n=1 Tax=Micromonospora carbonacea TaxID=47853 RepID=A0A1C5ACB9_9ACTN|nr:hypothetical protein [Micromonospora carbonacea]SCF42888.1 hypothetical protein GA0070563_112149 [Micromonospora carbonacea]
MTALVWPSVMVTGHRPKDIPRDAHGWVRDKLGRGVAWLRDERGMTTGITGMALGADMWWADKLHRGGVPFVAHIPFPQQPDRWRRYAPEAAVAEWERLRALADRDREVVYGDLAGLAEHARKRVAVRLLHKRNDGMLSASNAVVAVWCPSKLDGGTHSALTKAHRAGLPVIHINPEARTVTLPSRTGLARLLYPTAPEPLIPA